MDAISILVMTFVVGVLFVAGLILIAIFLAIFRGKVNNAQSNGKSVNKELNVEKQIEKDIAEDSEGDGLMLFDDPMFPPEFDDEEYDF